MPRKSERLLRLPEIRKEISGLSVPVVDRSIFEFVFQVGRRRAIQLMHRFGAYESGRTFLLARHALLHSLESGDEFSTELHRKGPLSAELDLGTSERLHIRAGTTDALFSAFLAGLIGPSLVDFAACWPRRHAGTRRTLPPSSSLSMVSFFAVLPS